MEDDSEMEIDPAMAEAMGFTGFGTQGKKRKFNLNDGFVDAEVSGSKKQDKGTGSNNTPLGAKAAGTIHSQTLNAAKTLENTNYGSATAAQEKSQQHAAVGGSDVTSSAGADQSNNDRPTLEALRNGVRNEAGDMVYFLPSFIEDPWKDLRPK